MKLVVLLGALLASLLAGPAAAQDGACCIPPCNDCFVVSQAECDSLGGMWFGAGTVCDPNP